MTNYGHCNITVYKCHDRGVLLPISNEFTWSIPTRATLYIIGLLWSFLGVSLIADIFMQSIEMITSKTRTIKAADPNNKGEYIIYQVKVWNATVANLTLMALGSSAPEILLSCADIIFNKFKSGDLGPGTIVGSAAFNMLVITAVCIFSIPNGEARRISGIKVFAVTTFFSMFAYIWLIVVLIGHTRGYVDLWEAIVTLLFFPLLVMTAYVVDKEFCFRSNVVEDHKYRINIDHTRGKISLTNMEEDSAMDQVIKKVAARPSLNHDDVAKITAKFVSNNISHSKGWYRINAIRNITGGQKLEPQLNEHQNQILERIEAGDDMTSRVSLDRSSEGGTLAILDFASPALAVSENDGHVKVHVNRSGKLNNRVICRLETVDGTANAEEDYIPIKQTMVFEPQQTQISVDITIINDNQWEPDEVFFVRLTVEDDHVAKVGSQGVCQVTILNDDDPGTLEFTGPSYLVKENCGNALIPVHRANGIDGKVSVTWVTEDLTAREGEDYLGREGVLEFEHNQAEKNIEIPIIDDQVMEKDENFTITLRETTGGAALGRMVRTVVTIVNDNEFGGLLKKVSNMTRRKLDAVRMHRHTWRDQFRSAMSVNGGDIENATNIDYVMHFFTFIWKLLFAIVPPVSICGGWLAFFCALIMIAIVTTLIGDLAGIFGCLIGLEDAVTAITLVALGTSLPDLFASKQAATQEPSADNAIGNITGSNSVNVFLGLGLPWVIATIYWELKNERFKVPVGSLGFSVVIYVICSTLCTIVLLARRHLRMFGRTELGGSTALKYISAIFLILLWFAYVIISSLQTYKHITVSF